jgi:hypothetical protein
MRSYASPCALTQGDKDFLNSLLLLMAPKKCLLPSERAEKSRFLSKDKEESPNRFGAFKWAYTPYAKEIIDLFAPKSGYKKIVIQKCNQAGFTTTLLDNLLLYYIVDEPPAY